MGFVKGSVELIESVPPIEACIREENWERIVTYGTWVLRDRLCLR